MHREERKLRFLEGLGYVAAFMIGVGGLYKTEILAYFNVVGLVFAIIVIVRLMVMSISMGLVQRLYEPPADEDSPTTEWKQQDG
jgi:hypothetical protein